MPADYARRMGLMLNQMRRNMDGVTAEAMYNAGVRGVLNYGVGIPTIRAIARAEQPDHQFAKYLYRQQVRELRMAAVTVAQPECVTAAELPFWLEGNPSTELLDELAMQLISRTSAGVLSSVIDDWLGHGDAAARYTAMMALSRARGYDAGRALTAMEESLSAFSDDIRMAHGAVTMAASIAAADESQAARIRGISERLCLMSAVVTHGISPAARHFADEIEWMI